MVILVMIQGRRAKSRSPLTFCRAFVEYFAASYSLSSALDYNYPSGCVTTTFTLTFRVLLDEL